ncbi:hypothetical protein H1C71_000655 [Ictidomys tridecemlineatus]|nr:hypothetical protein H1C71_000655 [Ictidomys tridecemlineatus]
MMPGQTLALNFVEGPAPQGIPGEHSARRGTRGAPASLSCFYMGMRPDAGPPLQKPDLPTDASREMPRRPLGVPQGTAPDLCTKAVHFNPEDFSDCHQPLCKTQLF